MVLVTQNFDDRCRMKSHAARDYAANILESCQPMLSCLPMETTIPIRFGMLKVEESKKDVRVINLSLIAWWIGISKINGKFNESPLVKMSIPQEN